MAKKKQIDFNLSPEQVVNAVEGNYSAAIRYYNNLKNNIIQLFSLNSNEYISKEVQEEIIKVITDELGNSTIVQDVIFKDFPDEAVDIIIAALEGKSIEPFINERMKKYNSIANRDTKEGKEQVKILVNEIAQEINKTEALFNSFETIARKKIGEGFEAVDLTDIKSQMPSIQRQIIRQFLKHGGSKGFKNSTAAGSVIIGGYFREAIVASALARYFASKNFVDITAKQVGSVKINSKDTPVDVLFGKILGEDLEKILSKMNDQLDLSNSLNAVGIQVKSASLPERVTYKDTYRGKRDESGLLKKFRDQSTVLKIGERASILQSFGGEDSSDTYWWRKGLIHNSQSENVIESLGAGNVMWVTGKQAMWTDDFIKNFLKNRFRLNFEYVLNKDGDAYKATSQIILAYHNSNLRSANLSRKS